MIDERLLKNEERAVYALRSLYRRFGYARYKMSKFEEYDLYARNKAFLVSDEIITFTGGSGKLMALRPDVTLSIVKNSQSVAGAVQKLYYNEYVYRMSRGTGECKEIMQTGLECIGDVRLYHICEVLTLATKSLAFIDGDYILDISHAGLVSALLDGCVREEMRDGVLACIRAKNPGGVANLSGVTAGEVELARILAADYADFNAAAAALEKYGDIPETRDAMDEFSRIYVALEKLGLTDKIRIDFSIANNMSYYSGVVFKGYIKGIPTSVLSGGQYDKLMRKLGHSFGAIGFAVYLDVLERFKQQTNEYDADVVLLCREGDDPARLISTVERLSANGESVAVLSEIPPYYLYRRAYVLAGEEAMPL